MSSGLMTELRISRQRGAVISMFLVTPWVHQQPRLAKPSLPRHPNFVLDFVGSSSPSLVNYHINTAAPTVTPPFFFDDDSLTPLGVTTATPFDIIWAGGSIGLNLPVQGNQTVSGSGTWFGGTVSTVFGNNLPLFQTVTIFNDGVGNVINFMAVPEPSTYAMLLAGVGCGAAGIVRRRRHSVRTP